MLDGGSLCRRHPYKGGCLLNENLGWGATMWAYSSRPPDPALRGDWLKKHLNGGEFRCDAPQVDQPRVEAFEVSPIGPMFGPELRPARDEALALEQEVLAAEGVTLATFSAGGGETLGTRRFNRVPLEALEVEGTGADLALAFTLPAGSYATVVLRELFKPG